MEQLKKYALLVQCGNDCILSDKNDAAAWQTYGSDKSFRSAIDGHVLIMDEHFYADMPSNLKPLPTVRMIVVGNANNIPIGENVIVARTLVEALLLSPKDSQRKKRYIAGSPLLFTESVARLSGYDCEEIIAMQKDEQYSKGIKIPLNVLSDTLWKTIPLSTIPKDKHQPCTLTFCQYKKIA